MKVIAPIVRMQIEMIQISMAGFIAVALMADISILTIETVVSIINKKKMILRFMFEKEHMRFDFPFKKKWGESCGKRYWEEDSIVVLDTMKFEAILMPEHSPGSVCITIGNCIISGDLVFRDSIGRTDFIGGNIGDMFESLEKIIKLSEEVYVLPGHGALTTIAEIKMYNQYVKAYGS